MYLFVKRHPEKTCRDSEKLAVRKNYTIQTTFAISPIHKPDIVVVTSFSLRRHSHYDVIGATPTVTDVRTSERTNTLLYRI